MCSNYWLLADKVFSHFIDSEVDNYQKQNQ